MPPQIMPANIKECLLNAIDHLRDRKSRPDMQRICSVMKRRHGYASEDVENALSELIDDKSVVKGGYKGQTSYRNAKRPHEFGGKRVAGHVVVNVVRQALGRLVSKRAGILASMNTSGIKDETGSTFSEIADALLEFRGKCAEAAKQELADILEYELELGRIEKTVDDRYRVLVAPDDDGAAAGGGTSEDEDDADLAAPDAADSPPATAEPKDLHIVPSTPGPPASTSNDSNHDKKTTSAETKNTQMIRKGKSRSQKRKSTRRDGNDIKRSKQESACDYCWKTCRSNRAGEFEDLLVCKDCKAKAHPSCMNYSAELAKRSRMSPWQCTDCKTCVVCNTAADADTLLFCDSCDKGYHMQCHKPRLRFKPIGNWACQNCARQNVRPARKIQKFSDVPSGVAGAPQPADCVVTTLPPTPRQSPVEDSPKAVVADNRQIKMLNGKKPKKAQANDGGMPVPEWTVDDVIHYFRKTKLHRMEFDEFYAKIFRESEIDGKSLLLLKRMDVLKGISMEMKIGPALKIYDHIKQLQITARVQLNLT